MTAPVVIKAITPETTEQDWERALYTAGTLAALRAHLAPWARFVPDALVMASRMGEREFQEFRAGFLLCISDDAREGPGQGWMERWQELVMPTPLIDASKKAERYDVTLGVVLLGVTPN